MSLVITVSVREGIVMAADSRLTLNTQERQGENTVVNLAVSQSAASYKLFLAPCGVGISSYGAADIEGVPIAGYMDSFITAKLEDQPSARDVAQRLLEHFAAFTPVPKTLFHVAGYARGADQVEQEVWGVNVEQGEVSRLGVAGQQGVSFGGEADILSRILSPAAQLDADGTVVGSFPHYQMPFQFFTLQDAIDFAVFAIRSTIDAIRFEPRPKTVGGPIDVLVIRPSEAFWVQRKQLRVD